jgi:hypothetical protein
MRWDMETPCSHPRHGSLFVSFREGRKEDRSSTEGFKSIGTIVI